MKVTINVKLVNSKFDQAYADAEYDGKESDDNIKYLWEDEFIVKGDVASLKVKNNAVYQLKGLMPDDTEFCYDIPDTTLVECAMADGSLMQFPFSKKLVSKTDKKQDASGIMFSVFLKSSKPLVNPMDGVYILEDDFPRELM